MGGNDQSDISLLIIQGTLLGNQFLGQIHKHWNRPTPPKLAFHNGLENLKGNGRREMATTPVRLTKLW